jgi:hypothetical protein
MPPLPSAAPQAQPSVQPPEWWFRWRPAKTVRAAINPLALAVEKATASSPCETPSVFFEGLNALKRGLFYARHLFEATRRQFCEGKGKPSRISFVV